VIRECFCRAVPAVAVAMLTTTAHAQSRLVVAPSISVGFVYDDNVFYEETGNLEAIWRLTPALTVTRETARTALLADVSFDVERFREHASLSTPLARQSALLRVRHEATPRIAVGVAGGLESTRAPTELNLTTGLLTGRRRAMRFYGGPSLSGNLTPRLTATLDYTLNADVIPEGSLLLADEADERGDDVIVAEAPASRLWTHLLGSRLAFDVTPRHQLRVDYVGRWFVFADPAHIIATPPLPSSPAPAVPPAAPDPIVRHTALLGWSYSVNPAVTLEVAAGPRLRFGDAAAPGLAIDGIEIEALLARQRVTHDVFLSYVRTVTTAVGLTSLVDVDRGILRGVYRPPFGVQAHGELGFYRSAVDLQDVSVVHVAGGVTLPLGGPVALGVSYGVDLQYGRFGLDPARPPTTLPGPEIDPRRFRDPDAPMRRGVAMIQLIISPPTRPTPEDPPPGATPVRRPPIKAIKGSDR
jgi:hypothetical protein